MTVELYGKKAACVKSKNRLNRIFFKGKPVIRCFHVKVSNVKKADHCGVRPVPMRKVSKGSKGYVAGAGFISFKGCGLTQI